MNRWDSHRQPYKPWLSVIVPVYNEAGTVDAVLRRLREGPYPEKEVIVIDDGSRDGTQGILKAWAAEPGFILLRHTENRGKGAAIQTGLAQAVGQIVVIQDADLEYNPADLPLMVEMIRRGEAAVVYGSRYMRPRKSPQWSKFRLAVTLLNFLVWLLYGRFLTDQATCYKVLPTELLLRLRLTSRRFEFCSEVTAKLCRLGVAIVEVPVSYLPRTAAQGKKICWRDVWPTFWMLLKWRFLPLKIRSSGLPPGREVIRSFLEKERSGQLDSLTRQCADIVS